MPTVDPSREHFLIMRPRWFCGFVAVIIVVTAIFAGGVAAAMANGHTGAVLLSLAALLVLSILLSVFSGIVIPGFFWWQRRCRRIKRGAT